MAAETGSGKTGAFCLPVLQIVHESRRAAIKDAGAEAGGGTVDSRAKKAKLAPVHNPFRMNNEDRDDMFAVGPDGLLCQSREEWKWQGCRAVAGLTSGKHYFEAEMTDEGLCRIGWSTAAAKLDLGTDNQGYGFGGTGKKSFGRSFDSYGEPYGLKDILGCYLNLDDGTIHYSKNGNDFGEAFRIAPHLKGSPFYPACVIKNAELKFNFGALPFKFPPAGSFAGYSGVDSAAPEQRAKAAAAAAGGAKSGRRTPLAIILEPSKELAHQTFQQILQFKKYLPAPQLREMLLIGGEGVTKSQIQALRDGVEIVVGTPGRVEHMVKEGKLDVSQVQFFVLDEVDGLLSNGHGAMLDALYKKFPKNTEGTRLQMVVASATLHSPEVKKLADRMMYHPTWVDLKGLDSVPDTVHHVVVPVDPTTDARWHAPTWTAKTDGVHSRDGTSFLTGAGQGAPEALSEGVKMLKYQYLVTAVDAHKMDQAIIFCRTKMDCDNLEAFLLALGGGARAMVNSYSCCCVHGDRSAGVRRENLQKFKDGEMRFMICTDVAARGIDIRGIPYVINMTMPDEKENYIHRIGRVGRAERMGLAISLVSTVKEKVWYCASKRKCPGNKCTDTRLLEKGGCTIWYDEPQLLRDVESHLGVVIGRVGPDINIPVDEFDGKVTYGEKKGKSGTEYKGHVDALKPAVADLARLEEAAQSCYLTLRHRTW